jgi:hypothetical protein
VLQLGDQLHLVLSMSWCVRTRALAAEDPDLSKLNTYVRPTWLRWAPLEAAGRLAGSRTSTSTRTYVFGINYRQLAP